MMPSSIFQPASAGLREGAPRAGTVQPVKSLPLKSGFHGSADCSDAASTKQSNVTTPTEMRFIGILLPWNSEDVERGILMGICFLLHVMGRISDVTTVFVEWRDVLPLPSTGR